MPPTGKLVFSHDNRSCLRNGPRRVAGQGLATEFEGKTYYFCSDACREEFEACPEQYALGAGVGRLGHRRSAPLYLGPGWRKLAGMNLATLDIGTNTTLLLVARGLAAGAPELVEERAEITRLGRGIGAGGRAGAQGIAPSLALYTEFAAVARPAPRQIAAIGTEALRRAPNAADFLDPGRQGILGGPVEVIDGRARRRSPSGRSPRPFPTRSPAPLRWSTSAEGSRRS